MKNLILIIVTILTLVVIAGCPGNGLDYEFGPGIDAEPNYNNFYIFNHTIHSISGECYERYENLSLGYLLRVCPTIRQTTDEIYVGDTESVFIVELNAIDELSVITDWNAKLTGLLSDGSHLGMRCYQKEWNRNDDHVNGFFLFREIEKSGIMGRTATILSNMISSSLRYGWETDIWSGGYRFDVDVNYGQ